MPTKIITKLKTKQMLSPGHRACAGCGQMIAARTVAQTLGPDTIIANATGCLEVTTTPYPESSWGMPWIHSLFENAAAIGSGIKTALNYKKNNHTKVVVQGGDGATFDIGLGLISGMWERQEDILYICYDTEAYSNTGIQASGATPWAANTTTTPAGKGPAIEAIGSQQRKKDMIAIALAHGLPYVAQTTAGFPDDIVKRVKKALSMRGPSYIQILTPCIPGWSIHSSLAIKMGKLAAQTGLYPILEYVNGRLADKLKVPKQKIKVEKYLEPQGRFKHLFNSAIGKEQIKHIQREANKNILKYGL
ncbi:pyruvate ferredoxin oxidoreductase [Candidatus Falkowbacteria bacterium CG_4_9_14_3_um_filter_36_9]|uniref:Pyruvate ferredoxin oxidoreductase n=1 Tax=Candidatus Falkowbacteria bacterium CG02_land_8_20_14_3_00_36_14 TaxID=1974560 RepID=A0A2M7DMC6_9BACT|nr:MAG: pyruvate ferredoxin oxidoreductase [Candidatus Falkowbacteria bacterium CG02_land_8_20_14_3_00_36_14]PIX12222.1 MAG: pyruvate ferredoxin oxidoreductase [Candidatus Falkowbacteria bacterium CG_4_8_14_3_um_filter_36_11]PJA10677.1 MAG: pyruvate ferredoxin oxidoreductase [Candidatus Falkowbacteria bacterium CG_4_10_14_0_2_um_filter_36_22]PJB18346.1 MAG: pyruvate ferredoxin oxidoreductase [Candidatus Falkowbacteria bacterium CG_4_9_14_3_um_filter_36_9]